MQVYTRNFTATYIQWHIVGLFVHYAYAKHENTVYVHERFALTHAHNPEQSRLQSNLGSSLHEGAILGLFTAANSVIQTTTVSSHHVLLPIPTVPGLAYQSKLQILSPSSARPARKAALNTVTCCVNAIYQALLVQF